MFASNGSTVGQIKEKIMPAAKTATHKTGMLIHGFSFDPHPTRSKFIMGSKIGLLAFVGGILAAIGWKSRKS